MCGRVMESVGVGSQVLSVMVRGVSFSQDF